MIEPLFHPRIRVCWCHPAIDEHQGQLQLIPIPQIILDHRSPILFYGLRDFGVSVTRKVHKVHPVINQKEVDRLRPAR